MSSRDLWRMFSDYISEIPCFELCLLFQSPSFPAIHNPLVWVENERDS